MRELRVFCLTFNDCKSMSKMKVNAAFQRVAILNKEGYVSRAVTYSKIDGEDVLEYAAQNSGINQAQLSAAMYAIRQSFVNFLLNGHSVELPGVGIFRVGVNAKMVDEATKVSVDQIYRRKIHFLPSTVLKDRLTRISFSTDPTEMDAETTTPTVPDEGDNEGPDII